MSEFGNTVRDLRQMREWSLQNLADRVGTSSTHISNLERGVYSPTLRTAQKIAGAFDTTVWKLLKDAGV